MFILNIQEGNKKTIKYAIMVLFVCMHAACGNANDRYSNGQIESSNKEEAIIQKPKESENPTENMVAEQLVFTAEDLPEEISKLLSYDGWRDDTQVVICTKEDIQRSGMVKEFQQILNGDFSAVEGLRNEDEREEFKRDYKEREKWEYMLQDMNGDGIEGLRAI